MTAQTDSPALPDNRHRGWLDKLAISMAAICAVHCLLAPALIVMIPIIATTFFAHENFHVWMLILVLPTSIAAVFLGCRKHRDRFVGALSAVGIILMVSAVLTAHDHHYHAAPVADHHAPAHTEAHHHHAHTEAHHHHAHAEAASHSHTRHPILNAESVLTTFGGIFLVAGHFRNYRLCRRADCCH